MSTETFLVPSHPPRALTFEPAGPVMRNAISVIATVGCTLTATILIVVIGTLIALILGGVLAGLAMTLACNTAHHDRGPRAPHP